MSKKTELKQKYIDKPSAFHFPNVGMVGVGGDFVTAEGVTITEVKSYDDLYKYCQISGLKFFKTMVLDAKTESLKKAHKIKMGELLAEKREALVKADGDDVKAKKIGEKYDKLISQANDKLNEAINE